MRLPKIVVIHSVASRAVWRTVVYQPADYAQCAVRITLLE